MPENAIWNSRRQALMNGIKNARGSLKDLPPQYQVDTIDIALEHLQEWTNIQYDYFVNAFENGSLKTPPEIVPDFALRRTLDQMAYDLLLLKRAYYQRLTIKNTLEELETLEKADRVARWALDPAIHAGLIAEDTTEITYFQKSPDVRVIPYVLLALIGIPYTCTDLEKNLQDILAIPHEVGHYVYWHGGKDREDLQNRAYLRGLIVKKLADYKDMPNWISPWIEEIFADIYSTLVAGSIAVYSLQEMLFDNLHFNHDDGRHPVPRIRPFAQHRVLHKLKVDPEQLLKDWLTKVNIRGYQDNDPQNALPVEVGSATIPYETAKEVIEKVAENIFDILADEFPLIVEQTWFGDTSQSFAELIEQFRRKIAENDALPGPKPLQGNNQLDQWFHRPSGEGGKSPLGDWLSLLINNGWLVAGPETDHD